MDFPSGKPRRPFPRAPGQQQSRASKTLNFNKMPPAGVATQPEAQDRSEESLRHVSKVIARIIRSWKEGRHD